jgi:hypothetical protein
MCGGFMDLRYCGRCGEAFLVSKGSCLRCEHTKPSENNAGVKTAMLLGLLVISVPSQVCVERDDGTTEKQSDSDRSVQSTHTTAFPENEIPSEAPQEVKGIGNSEANEESLDSILDGVKDGFDVAILTPEPVVSPKYGTSPPPIPSSISKVKVRIVDFQDKIKNQEDCQQQANKILLENLYKVKYCHKMTMKSDEIKGNLKVGIIIDEGKVTNVEIKSNETGSEAVGTCVQGKIKRWRFPKACAAEFDVMYKFMAIPHNKE